MAPDHGRQPPIAAIADPAPGSWWGREETPGQDLPDILPEQGHVGGRQPVADSLRPIQSDTRGPGTLVMESDQTRRS